MSYISATLQPARFGEIYSLFNTRLDGEVKWNSADETFETRGFSISTTPITSGAQAISLIPDGVYPMASVGSSLWVKLNRYSGSATASPVAYTSTQPTPSQDWIELAYRSDTDIINLFGGVLASKDSFSRVGAGGAGALYRAIVGPVGNPIATHTSIQTAIDDCDDGDRILILKGTYNISSPGNAGLDASSALAWSGKTLTIEGQGYGTVIVNTGALNTAFFIKADASGLGTASQIKNLKIQTFSKSAAFNGSLGAINDCSIEVYHYTASYISPTITGTGNENFVKEWVMPSYKIIENRVRSGGLQTVTKENALTTITGTLKLTSLTASQAVVTDASQQLTTLAYNNLGAAGSQFTLVQRNSIGAVAATYFLATGAGDISNPTRVAVQNGDGYYQWATSTTIASFIGGNSLDLTSLHVTGSRFIDSQGGWIQWNRSGFPGFSGHTSIVNQRGLGTGGIVFGEADTSNNIIKQYGWFNYDGDFEVYQGNVIIGTYERSFRGSLGNYNNGSIGAEGYTPTGSLPWNVNWGPLFFDFHVGSKYAGDGVPANHGAISIFIVNSGGRERRLTLYWNMIGGDDQIINNGGDYARSFGLG